MKKIAYLFLILIVIASCDDNSEDLNSDISVPVSVMELQPQSIEKYINTTGTVQPLKDVTIKSEVGGNYKLLKNPRTRRSFVLGDYVKAGTDIIRIEDAEYENNIRIKSLKLQLDISKQVYEKQLSLYDKGGVTLSELKNSEVNYINADYAYEDAKIRLKKMHIQAPFSGIIVELPYITPNNRIDMGTELFRVMDYSKLQLDFNLAEKNMSLVDINQKVRVINYTIPDDTLSGKIAQISPAIDPQTRSFKAIVSIDNKELLLRPGMFAKCEVIVSSRENTIVIPKDIILSKQRGNTVYVIDKSLAQERVVTFGLENPNEVEIIDGLNLNERIVTKGFETLRNRSKVKVVK